MKEGSLNTIDLSAEASHLWTTKAKKLMDQHKFTNTVGQIMNGDGSKFSVQAAYYACTVPREETMDAVKLVVGQMNYLVSKGLVHGFVSDIVGLEIIHYKGPMMLVACYPMVTDETYEKLVKKNKIHDSITVDLETRGSNG